MKIYNSFQRWSIVSASANYIVDMLIKTNCTLNLQYVIVSMMKNYIDTESIDWVSKKQMLGLKRDVIKHIKAIEEHDVISFKLGNIKEVKYIDLNRLEK